MGVLSLALIPFYLAELGKEQWGLVAVCISLQGFLMLLELGLSQYIPKQFTIAYERKHLSATLKQVTNVYFFLGLFLFAVAQTFLGDIFELIEIPEAIQQDALLAGRLFLFQFLFSFTNNVNIAFFNGIERQFQINIRAMFDKDTITAVMEKLKEDFDIPPVSSPVKEHLVHLRLTDSNLPRSVDTNFFKNPTEELNFLDKTFDELGPSADIICNNDALLEAKIRKVNGPKNNYHLIPTSTYSAYEILRLMLNYSTVSSNNSTLAFWAVLFSGNTLHLTDDSLKSLFQHLKVSSSK